MSYIYIDPFPLAGILIVFANCFDRNHKSRPLALLSNNVVALEPSFYERRRFFTKDPRRGLHTKAPHLGLKFSSRVIKRLSQSGLSS
jgi:hypothetical protein